VRHGGARAVGQSPFSEKTYKVSGAFRLKVRAGEVAVFPAHWLPVLPRKRSVMTTLNLIQHHPAEGPGVIAVWAESRGLTLKIFRADLGQLPPVSAAPAILLGGPYESNAGPTWLETERQWLAGSLDQGAAVFAICLGAQLLALSLGGRVRRMDRSETGWTTVHFVDGQNLQVLEWHEDAIDLPPNAQLLASSEQCEQQMYRIGPNRVGLQFHPEWDAESVAVLNQHFADESPLPRGVQDSAAYAAVFDWLQVTLDEWWSKA
jgi:GMP synthase-like glutamine amidotransferase